MIAQAVIVSVIWLAVAWSLNLSDGTATTGVVIAFLLSWRDERKRFGVFSRAVDEEWERTDPELWR